MSAVFSMGCQPEPLRLGVQRQDRHQHEDVHHPAGHPALHRQLPAAKNLARMISGFSVKLLAYDPFVKEAVPGQNITFVDTLEELFERSDIVSLHMPFMPSTARIINKSLFERMKPHAYLVNTCRGGVIDEADLIEALKTGKLAGAGLDVLTEEPPKADQPL